MRLSIAFVAVTALQAAVATDISIAAGGIELRPDPTSELEMHASVMKNSRCLPKLGKDHGGPEADHSRAKLVKSVADWLICEFDLPPIETPPILGYLSAHQMLALRYRNLPTSRGDRRRVFAPSTVSVEHIVAVYDDKAKTIYLPLDWTGETLGDISVLVHEMVHHVQTTTGRQFDCPNAREQMAFDAQGRWLALFGSSLAAEFEMDSLTLLVSTKCLR